ncbi:MAG: DUF2782 domain-containing protein [Xanthomonadales bacterium]|nr:DUF2782 domain-containing protein [Xanthomonadales bacterium]MCC6560617.1 DUF2782 domain-containing protein [Xanthomonadales bacterium]
MRILTLILALALPLPIVLAAAPATTDKPDAKPATQAEAAPTKVADAPRPSDPPLPEKAQPPEEPPPTVTIRNVKGALIEEYRHGSQLYMIRVVPERGVPYTYLDTDGNGRLEYEGEDGPVRPVYYTLYEWD